MKPATVKLADWLLETGHAAGVGGRFDYGHPDYPELHSLLGEIEWQRDRGRPHRPAGLVLAFELVCDLAPRLSDYPPLRCGPAPWESDDPPAWSLNCDPERCPDCGRLLREDVDTGAIWCPFCDRANVKH